MGLGLALAGLILVVIGLVIPVQLLWIAGVIVGVIGVGLYFAGYRGANFSRTRR